MRDTFLQLIRLGIGTSKDAKISKNINWIEIKALAERQGLSAVVLDGIDKANTNFVDGTSSPSQVMKLEWIGEVMQNYEARYTQYENAIASLASFYNTHGFKMMVLKGYTCSLDWPKPKHRPCGDIDIWQFGKQKEADSILKGLIVQKFKEFNIDDSHEHHTVFIWDGFMVENHYDFIDTHHRASSSELEKIFKELGSDDTNSVDVKGEKVYVPSQNLHALFLLRHMMEHFASEVITIRHLLDWGFYVEGHTKEIEWAWLESVLGNFGMTPAYEIFNAICVEDLGFSSESFPNVQCLPE